MMLSGLGSLQSTAPGFSSVMAIKSAFSSVVCRGRIRRPAALPAGRCGLVGWRIVRFAGGCVADIAVGSRSGYVLSYRLFAVMLSIPSLKVRLVDGFRLLSP